MAVVAVKKTGAKDVVSEGKGVVVRSLSHAPTRRRRPAVVVHLQESSTSTPRRILSVKVPEFYSLS